MRLKKGVILTGLQLEMRQVKIAAEAIWKNNGQECVITSGLDGKHSVGSLHPFGYALDLRTNYFDKITKIKVSNELQIELGQDYEVHLESTHIHVEYSKIIRT